jgi:hypothetical protein
MAIWRNRFGAKHSVRFSIFLTAISVALGIMAWRLLIALVAFTGAGKGDADRPRPED